MELRQLLPRTANKLHWRDMPDVLRARSVEVVSRIDAAHVIVVASPLNTLKQERARRQCLEVMLPVLESMGVEELVLESRNLANEDCKDVALRNSMLRKRYILGIRVVHMRGDSDERLWVPDQVIGAYGDSLKNGVPEGWNSAWDSLLDRLAVYDITPR